MQEASPDADAGKPEWRRWFRRQLKRPADPRDAAALCRHAARFLAPLPPMRTAIFAALPGEPDLLGLLAPPHHWHLPRVEGETLVLHPVADRSQLEPGAFGILEPPASFPATPPEAIDLFFCPGLGFDRHGIRLGRGKGYYDRVLAQSRPDCVRIGVAFAGQVVDRLPGDPHDHPMTHLLTPAGIVEI